MTNTKNILVFLFFSLICFTSCTTLDEAEQCALIGQFQEGTQIGTNTQIGSIGSYLYSYQTRAYNPICKLPTTIKEKELVDELYPIAKRKQEKQVSETRWVIMGTTIFLIGVALFLGI